MQKKVTILKSNNLYSSKNKKSQAAMEFLMTYGWAILIVLVAIAALYFLGVFSGKTPNSCSIEPPFNCIDSFATAITDTAGSGALKLQIGTLNSIKPAQLANIQMFVDGATICDTTKTLEGQAGEATEIPSGGKDTVVCTDAVFDIVDEKFNGEMIITYDSKVGLAGKTARGTFSGQVREA